MKPQHVVLLLNAGLFLLNYYNIKTLYVGFYVALQWAFILHYREEIPRVYIILAAVSLAFTQMFELSSGKWIFPADWIPVTEDIIEV